MRHLRGDHKIWDGATRTNILAPTNFFVIGETHLIDGLTEKGKSTVSTGKIHIETEIVLREEDLEAWGWEDTEGKGRFYHEAYGDTEQISVFEQGKLNENLNVYYQELWKATKYAEETYEKWAKSIFVIPVFIQRKRRAYFGDITMSTAGAHLPVDKKQKVNKESKSIAQGAGVSYNY